MQSTQAKIKNIFKKKVRSAIPFAHSHMCHFILQLESQQSENTSKTSTSTWTVSEVPQCRRHSPAVSKKSHCSNVPAHNKAKWGQLIRSHLIAQTDDGPMTDCETKAGDS